MYHIINKRKEVLKETFPEAMKALKENTKPCRIESEDEDCEWEKVRVVTSDETHWEYWGPNGERLSDHEFENDFEEKYALLIFNKN